MTSPPDNHPNGWMIVGTPATIVGTIRARPWLSRDDVDREREEQQLVMAAVLRSRRELRELLGATPTELDTMERQGVVTPSHRGPDGRTGMYDEIDCSLATVALHAFRIGIRGRALIRLVAAARVRAPRLAPGWAGWVAFDGAVVELCRTSHELADLVASYRSVTALVVVPVSVGEPR